SSHLPRAAGRDRQATSPPRPGRAPVAPRDDSAAVPLWALAWTLPLLRNSCHPSPRVGAPCWVGACGRSPPSRRSLGIGGRNRQGGRVPARSPPLVAGPGLPL